MIRRAVVLAVTLLIFSTPAWSSAAWINDSLYVPIRAAASPSGRILHRGIRTGTRIQFVRHEGDWSLIRFGSIEGYIERQYLSLQPIAAVRLERANQENESLKSEVATLKSSLETVRQERNTLAQENERLEAAFTAQGEEVESLQQVAAEPLRLDQANRRLNEEISLLRSELDQMKAENVMLRSDNTSRQWLTGVGIMLIGIIAGMIMRTRSRRQRNSGWAN